ncbi:LOW QUALITY PROTEIN: uncharacterized protein LOC112089026 [Eutrema salsugineum]|uniref:LOW QUALITY PROTEIN: uncharacterized protein LOC112089026 n=1 Tax=Eutrema salsugineum TaxID=72664 RepID=UPI000CED08AF|nr:LOW QUALITY PROTEIN: uncharacterized protein LOC112089026 [Eutrema salsugineum]
MCMFCGLYSWSLIHTLCNKNSKNSISLLLLLSFWFGGFNIKCSCPRTETKKKLVKDMIHIYVLFSLVHR